ncbi:hypothetical protein FB451DRAFT_1223213 [Mycena latifolia]|nr:hypothetical protein FB451DRAFT_1223213 [Mycena latifolia]
MSSAPILPVELQREILDLAVQSSTKCIPKLRLVAHWVNAWLESLLYRVVVFRDPLPGHVCFAVDQLLASFRSKPPSFAQEHVHHLFVNLETLRHPDVGALLDACTGVQNLVLINDLERRPWLLP